MNNYNTLFGQLLSQIKRPEFDKLCKTMNSDKFRKDFSTWDQFVVMAFAQITSQNGLRSIENALNCQMRSFYHLGLTKEVKRSTISYANKNHGSEFFESLYYQLFSTLDRGARKVTEKKLYAVDATTIGLCLSDFSWAKFRSTKSGVKIHVKYDVEKSAPEYLFITNAEEHENNTLGKMNLAKGDIVAFDKGYNNYAQFSEFCDNGVYFVTRLKDNAAYKVIKRRKTHTARISSDHIIQFTGQAAKHKCPNELRRIRAVDNETGCAIVLLTNMRSCTAEKVAELYRKRWHIELFFKTIKQNLKIKRFYGTSENAVKTQIWIAMIVYLLFMLLKKRTGCLKKSFTHFISEISIALFQRIDLNRWFTDSSPPIVVRAPDVSFLQIEFSL
jgi:hypothetical protein